MVDHSPKVVVSDFLLACKGDLLKVKGLFRERKYRRCVVLCSQALQQATHPVHRTFLHFYQAICYEHLGHISHNYSSNKIPLLEQARDSFISANDLLPLPFLTAENGQYDEPKPSPLCATEDLLQFYHDSPSIYPESTPLVETTRRGRGSVRSTPDPMFDRGSVAYSVPNLDSYSPRVPLSEMSNSEQNRIANISAPKNIASSHKSRLSRSLSSQHVLADELVPSPLYSRAPSSRKEKQASISSTVSPMPFVTLSKPLPPIPVNRPLPTLPFNPYPRFMLKGKRIVVVANRKTALSTLIQKFEGRGPFDGSPGQGTSYVNPTPITERFKRISAVFDAKEDSDEENMPPGTPIATARLSYHKHSPVTPCPNPSQQANRQVPDPDNPTHLEFYNTHLSAFRASLLVHISTVSDSITRTRTIQLEHDAEKRRNFVAMNSSSIPAPRSDARSKSRGGAVHQTVKDARLRSFWSLQAAEAQDRVEKSGSGWEVERKTRERRERIEKLRISGWRDVRKEAKGFKGSEYYDELRRVVEEELNAMSF